MPDHFYTVDENEKNQAINRLGYKFEGTACFVHRDWQDLRYVYADEKKEAGFVYLSREAGTDALYALVHPRTGEHFYTLGGDEGDSAVLDFGYRYYRGEPHCFVFKKQVSGTVPLYRMYRQGTDDHMYTTSVEERDNTLNYVPDPAPLCYVMAGENANNLALRRYINGENGHHMLWFWGTMAPYFLPLRRTFNPHTGDHFYTTDWQEWMNSYQIHGYMPPWSHRNDLPGLTYYEQHLWPLASTTCFALMTVPFYRCFNPNNGDHFYTTSEAEWDAACAELGYRAEGIASYVYDRRCTRTAPLFRLFKP